MPSIRVLSTGFVLAIVQIGGAWASALPATCDLAARCGPTARSEQLAEADALRRLRDADEDGLGPLIPYREGRRDDSR